MIFQDYQIIRVSDSASLNLNSFATNQNNTFEFSRNVHTTVTGPTATPFFDEDVITEELTLIFVNKQSAIKNFFHGQDEIFELRVTENDNTFSAYVYVSKSIRNLHMFEYNKYEVQVTRFTKWFKKYNIKYTVHDGETSTNGYTYDYPLTYSQSLLSGNYVEGRFAITNTGSAPGTIDFKILNASEQAKVSVAGEYYQSRVVTGAKDYIHVFNSPLKLGIESNIPDISDKRDKAGKTWLSIPRGEVEIVVNFVEEMELVFYEYFNDLWFY